MSALEQAFAQIVVPEVDPSPVMAVLSAAREGHLCIPCATPIESHALVWEDGYLYLRRLWELEVEVAAHIYRLLEQKIPEIRNQVDPSPLLPEQTAAITKIMRQSLTLICGGPGTGKTYTIKHLAKRFDRVIFAAPTGKAAANFEEGVTLHALLGLREGHPPPRPFPLRADLVVVDEASMIDMALMRQLLASIASGTRLVLMGDPDQLPPVESGTVFSDMVMALPHCTARLTRCMRTDRSELLFLAGAIRNGSYNQEVLPISEFEPHHLYPKYHILTPLQKGVYGVAALNARLAACHRKASPIPILITRNSVRQGLHNGDAGFLDGDTAYFGDQTIPKLLLPRYQPAFCLSIHKSQGSEYDRVAVILPTGSERFGRSVLYTAVTRARTEVKLFSDPHTLKQVLASGHPRHSRLGARLSQSGVQG